MVLDSLMNFSAEVIPDETRFWMIRTKKGYFYNEFISERFVALGWNEILINNYKNEEKTLKEHIANIYGDKRPGLALNKCVNFISQIKEGDILIIPNEGSKQITFAKAGKYYEEEKCTTEGEIGVIYEIDNRELFIDDIKCPYKKRRSIGILRTVKNIGLNYHLVSAMSSYHGLCNFDEYALLILDCIYDIYSFRDDVSISVNVTKRDALKPREVTNLLYGLTEYLCAIVNEDCLETTINLNSPGKVRMLLKKIAKVLSKNCWCFLGILVVLTGGSVKDAELPGVVKVIQDFKTMNVLIRQQEAALETQRLDNELKNIEAEGQKLDNALKMIEIIEEAKSNHIDLDSLLGMCDILLETKEALELKSNESFTISGNDAEPIR